MDFEVNFLLRILNRKSKEIDAIYRSIALKLGLSESEFWILYTLAGMQSDCSQQDICREVSLSKQTINSGIRSLGRKGFLFLERTEGSGRSKKIQLTDQGRCFILSQIEPVLKAEREAFLQLSYRERESYILLSQIYEEYLEEEMDFTFEDFKMPETFRDLEGFLTN